MFVCPDPDVHVRSSEWMMWASDAGTPSYGRCWMGDKPLDIRQVGKHVDKPAWTVGEMLWMFFTVGMAWPFIWARHRKKTRITKYR